MQYELYIDIFFLVNFMMDYILLVFLNRIMSADTGHGRIAAGAAAGAAVTCLIILLPVSSPWLKGLLYYGAADFLMLKAGLKLEGARGFVKAFLLLYVCGFLLGGVMEWLRQYLKTGSLFFALALLGYWIAYGVWSLVEMTVANRQKYCKAILYMGEKSCCVRALIDTGNQLSDVLTGKPVSIITQEKADLLGLSKLPGTWGNIRYISYHSIGNTNGKLPVFCIDKICLTDGRGKAEIAFPVIAVCKDELDTDDYDMILNPDIYNFKGGRKNDDKRSSADEFNRIIKS